MAQITLNSSGVASNGILALQSNGTTTAVNVDASQRVGIGVTPSAFNSGVFKVIQVNDQGALFATTTSMQIGNNIFFDSAYKFIGTGYASRYYQATGEHVWATSTASGTAGGAITETQAMTLTAAGNLGIGTTSPINNGGYGGLSLNGTSGALFSMMTNGTESSRIASVGDETSIQCKATTGFISFVSGVSGGTERARIDTSGRLLVDATTATSDFSGSVKFAVYGTGYTCLFKGTTASNSVISSWNSATSGNNIFAEFYTEAAATSRGSISYNRAGGLVAYNTTSDYRAKTVNGSVQNALSKVALLKPSTGRMNGATEDIDFFVAHELQEVVPSAVTGEKNDVNEDNTPKYQMVDKSALIPLLTAAIQEQQAIIESLTQRITALEGQ